ncbi:unnamed protein product [Scytosiphon promiscuus]
MGCKQSKNAEDSAAARRNRELQRVLEQDKKTEEEKIKLLLLGPGESGKSTIFRQMKLIYGVISEEDRASLTPVVYANTISTIKMVIKKASSYGFDQQVADQESLAMVRDMEDQAPIDLRVGQAITALWKDPMVQKTWDRRSEYQVIESMKYFLDSMSRIMQPEYVATPQDILHIRIRSSGIVVDKYSIDGTTFEMYDVGGQRNERKKWIHCFDNVTAVIYVAALSEYNQGMFEDANTNRMTEAINLFQGICGNAYFKGSGIILLLNKKDLFAEKLATNPINQTKEWSDFKGACTFDRGVAYFLEKFNAANTAKKTVYHHVTCATDSENIRVVLNSCKDTVLRINFRTSGFMD